MRNCVPWDARVTTPPRTERPLRPVCRCSVFSSLSKCLRFAITISNVPHHANGLLPAKQPEFEASTEFRVFTYAQLGASWDCRFQCMSDKTSPLAEDLL